MQTAMPQMISPAERKQRASAHGAIALLAMLAPAILFPLELLVASRWPRFAFLPHPAEYPWELVAIAFFGTLATLGGVADWHFHRSGQTAVGKPEHYSHIAALAGGGLPLFILMSVASVHPNPTLFLLPVLVIVIYTTLFIAYDEFVFHRKRCGRFETLTHRALTIGNGLAFLAWAHWCFVRGAMHG
jgi:hypothetical protein